VAKPDKDCSTGSHADTAVLQLLTRRLLERRTGPNGSVTSLESAANAAYDDLVSVVIPLLGERGVDALVGRSFHIVERQFPELARTATDRRERSFADVIQSLPKQDLPAATDALAAFFTIFTGLLVTFIGKSLTTRLLAKAWPDAFPIDRKGAITA
jgi:hypothetical protein